MTPAEWIGAISAGFLLAVGIWQVAVSILNERRRTQPIVVAHEDASRGFGAGSGHWRVEAHATNEGQGAGFNVRWGVAYFGVRFAFRIHDSDPRSGNRMRVLHPRESVPPSGSWPISVASEELWAGPGVPEESDHYYWARYENAQGHVWETRNPPSRSADLDIRRVWFVRLREWREEQRAERLSARGRELESEILRELREGLDAERSGTDD